MVGTSDRVVEALAWLNRYTDAPGAAKKNAPAITIALSRQAGSGGAEIARAVGARLGWQVWDQELLDRLAADKGLNARLLEHLDERLMNWLEGSIRAFCFQEGSGEGAYLKGLLELLAALGKAGNCVIVGRGAPFVLPPETTLRVCVIAPYARRVAAVQKSQGLSAAEAERWVTTRERERLRFVNYYFHANAADPLLYDLVLNSERLTTDECAAGIAQAAHARKAHALQTRELVAV